MLVRGFVATLAIAVALQTQAKAGPKEDADRAIQHGLELRRHSADQEALQEFQRAYTLQASPRAAAQIGLAFQALGRWTEAEEKLTEALREAADPWIRKNRPSLEQSLKEVQSHVGSLEIFGSPAGAAVLVEGRQVGVLPLPGPVRASAGTVSLEVRAEGYLPILRNVSVMPDRLTRETVNLTTAQITPPPTNDRPLVVTDHGTGATDTGGDAGGWRKPTLWATGIGAVAFGATGVVALVIRGQKSSDLAQRTDTSKTCTQMGNGFAGPDGPACADLANSRDTWTAVAIGTLTTAALAGAGAVVLWVTRPKATTTAGLIPRLAAVADGHSTLVVGGWRF
jgi:hypothetical protein